MGTGNRPLVEVLYSPACPQNARFLSAVRDWLRPYLCSGQIDLAELRTDGSDPRVLQLLGIQSLAQLRSNVFIAVYVDGRRVSSVPLHPDEVIAGVRVALGLPPHDTPTAPWAWWGAASHPERKCDPASLSWVPVTQETAAKSLELCLCHHPSGGRTPDEHHTAGRELKWQLWDRVFEIVPVAGVIGLDGESPAGLIEIYPRHIARSAGFVTGDPAQDDPQQCAGETLTITCIEVAGGYPRTAVIDQAMTRLLDLLQGGIGHYHWVEGMGVYGWPGGTNPYWVFDKHGFDRVREISPGRSVLLRRRL